VNVTFEGGIYKADRGIKSERWEALYASAQPDNRSLKLDIIMADTPSKKLSLLIREANFVTLGLELVFYGMLALIVAGEFSYLLVLGIYTTLICFLLYYFFGISFTVSLTQSLTAC
jgi:hypothetical protein